MNTQFTEMATTLFNKVMKLRANGYKIKFELGLVNVDIYHWNDQRTNHLKSFHIYEGLGGLTQKRYNECLAYLNLLPVKSFKRNAIEQKETSLIK